MHTPFAAFVLLLAGACTMVQQPGRLPALAEDRAGELEIFAGESTPALPGSALRDVAPAGASASVPTVEPTSVAALEPAAAPVPARADSKSRTRVKAGVFLPSGDIEDLDEGFAFELAFAHEIIRFLALEVSLGYLDADGNVAGNLDGSMWAVPIFINARAQVPITIFEIYGGIGIGGMWVDLEAGPFDDDDFVAAGNAFLGAEIGLDALSIGIEAKYLISDEATDANAEIEGTSVMATLTFGF